MRSKSLNNFVRLVSSLGLVFLTFSPAISFAFSGYGDGSPSNPYRIGTCAQLQDMENNKELDYVLISNIDCTGIDFTSIAIGSAFTGTLDGQNHTISNLNIVTDGGMIAIANGATIKNINLEGGTLNCSYYCGGIVGDATDSTLSNLHSSMTVTGSSSYAGGLVGSMRGSTSLSQSSFSGEFTGDSYSAGLVGVMWDSGTSVNDSFVSGTINAISSYVGPIVGGFFSGTINNTYSSATLNAGGNYYDAGLVGDSQGAINNSFSATTINNPGGYHTGLAGIDPMGTYTNNFIDANSNSTADCGNTSGECTAENIDNLDPGYFKNNTSNGPFASWDFTTIWDTTAGYPVLRNLASFTDSTVPNNGDANGDATPDSYQSNVGSVSDEGGNFQTISIPASSGCSLDNKSSIQVSSVDKDSYTPQSNLAGFSIYCSTVGATVPVTIIYDKLYDTSRSVLREYNPTTHTYMTIPNAVFSTVTVGEVQKTSVTYDITDGATLDEDGLANGVIVDPVVLSTSAAVILPPTTGIGSPTDSNTASLLALGLLPIMFGGIVYYLRRSSSLSS